MTRKDYVAIASKFAVVNDRYTDTDVWTVLRAEIADVLAADNPYFDRVRFYAACKVTP